MKISEQYLNLQTIPIPDFTDPADDPSSPDYRLTAEHYPRYLLPPKPVAPNRADVVAKIEELPQPEPLQHNKEEVIIRSDDFGDFKFIREYQGLDRRNICLNDATHLRRLR